MYPMNLCEIMRDLVMSRCCFGYVSIVFVVSVMFFIVGYVIELYEEYYII